MIIFPDSHGTKIGLNLSLKIKESVKSKLRFLSFINKKAAFVKAAFIHDN